MTENIDGTLYMGGLTEKVIEYVQIATDVLLLRYPITCGLGVLYGISAYSLVYLFSPSLEKLGVSEYTKITSLPWYGFIALSLAICVTIQVRRRKLEPLPKPVENAILAIEVGVKTGKLPPAHAAMQYNRVVDTMISELDLKEEYKQQAEELRKMIAMKAETVKSLAAPSEKAQD